MTVLRRGVLDQRDRAILSKVWRRWAQSDVGSAYGDFGLTLSTVFYRVKGFARGTGGIIHLRTNGGLVSQGWLKRSAALRTLRPGPRFAGLDADGWPLEVVK